MEHGKKICKALKNIRSLVAQANDIPLQIEECTYEGHCTGTCPKCEAEARFLEEALQQRRDKGLPIRVEHLMSEENLRQIVESSSDENKFDNEDFAPLQGMPMPPEYWENEQVEETDDDIHVLEGDIAAPEEGQLVSVTMGLPAPEDVYKEKRRVLYKECQIAGIGFHDLKDVWDELYEGAELALVREKKNKYDKYAIAVALADDYDGDPDDFDFDFILGYVPRTENEHLATMIDMGWAEAFECELSQIHGSNPYKGSLYMRIYIVSKDETEDTNSHLLRVMELDKESFDSIMSSLATEGCCYFRWGGFPPWERTLPIEGNKVVFMNKQETDTILYLMHCIAVGDDKATSLVKDWERYVDDSCYYVFTNIKGPIIVRNEDIEFLNGKTNDNCQPESILDEEDTLKLRSLFE